MKIVMMLSIVLAGGLGGALLGWFGKCADGGCPLTATPWRGGVIGVLLGSLIAFNIGCAPRAGSADAAEDDADSAVVKITGAAAFAEQVLGADKPALVDFYADWCGPCRKLAPVVERVARLNVESLVVAKVNVDSNAELAREYQVKSIPHLVLIRDGKVVAQFTGYQNAEAMQRWIDQSLGKQDH